MRSLGLHMRLNGSLMAVAHRAVALRLPIFQSFFVNVVTNKMIQPTKMEADTFVQYARAHFSQLYVHGSYWINLASLVHTGYTIFKKELALAQRLSFTHMVLHPGTAKGAVTKLAGIDALARVLNTINTVDHGLKIVLENTAHGNLAVGSDLADFGLLFDKLDKPERVQFCLDTSHAHAFGYELVDAQKQDAFIALIDECIGLSRVQLIHLNDTSQERGSRIDQHAIIGHGQLGKASLQRLAQHPALAHIPLILELPALALDQEVDILNEVRQWL
jgi:deoxyribonuclease IV